MILQIVSLIDIALTDDDNFRRFKVVVGAPERDFGELRKNFPGVVRFEDKETAWVSVDALRNWRGKQTSADWQTSITTMIEAARPYGWLSPNLEEIRAHVEWR